VGNWIGGVPGQNDVAFFGLLPGGERATVNTGNHSLRALWFQAGIFYTFQGTGTLTLSNNASPHLLVVTNDLNAPQQSETDIQSHLRIQQAQNPGLIENYSEGGLRIGGRFEIQDHRIRFGGTGATHLAGQITGSGGGNANGNIFVGGSAANGTQPHLVLSGSNTTWGGWLHALDRGFVIVKSDQAIGRQSEKHAKAGGTFGFRSHLESPLTYKRNDQNNYIEAWGMGITRRAEVGGIGAIYNDGGMNSLDMRITINFDPIEGDEVGFGARGDREGGLTLSNYVGGSGLFVKLGPGLVVLSNTGNQRNAWTKATELRGGVLRLGSAQALPTASNLVLAGGILELGSGNFSRSLGVGNDQLRWAGDGGFSAFGGARSVTLGNGTLTWGSTANFIGNGSALLLSSRYANNVITLTNAISFGAGFAGQQREVRVARGENNAYGVLSGTLSGGQFGGLLKTGDGLLHITGANTYRGATVIRSGALRGNVPTNSNIQLAGGVLGIDSTFTRTIGTGNGQIQWTGSGGFAAYGSGEVLVQIGENQTITWGLTTNFIQSGQELRFGHHTANGTVVWDTYLGLSDFNSMETIRVERGQQAAADVEFRKSIVASDFGLRFVGNGRIDLTFSTNFLSATAVYGTELRLHGSGRLTNQGGVFDIRHGGTLRLANTAGGSSNNRINGGTITLAAGTLRLSSGNVDVSEQIGDLILEAGANTVGLSRGSASAELRIAELKRDSDSRATLNIEGNLADSLLRFRLNTSASNHAVNDSTGDPIIPWATNGDTWLIAHSDDADNGPHFLKGLANVNYYTAAQTGWAAAHNVRTNALVNLSNNRSINSLVLGGNLNLGNRTLTLNSGGLLVTGDHTLSGGTGGTITTGTPSGETTRRPLYIHNSGTLTFTDSARLTGGMDVVKTRTGSLIFNNSGTNVTQHTIGNLYIHQGTVELRGNGTLQVRRIYIGDGAGTDKLILPGNRWNPITSSSGLPSITLRGTPYDPRGPEYGGDQAILQLGGNTKQRLANLHIESRGTIDWRGGEVGKANILWIETLSFSSTNDRLFIRNWYEYEDLFLVKKVHNGRAFDDTKLNQIVFEGYQDYFPTLKDYDNDYWQITPWGAPEPSTYGAILGAVGLGLVVWRRRRTIKQGDLNRTVPKAR